MPRVKIYTDGACSGNPGPGGWAVLFVYTAGCKRLTGYELVTTNNVMELTAVIEALSYIVSKESGLRKSVPNSYHLYCDSGYVVNAVNGEWYKKWERNGWMTVKDAPVKNRQLWERFIELKQELRPSGVKLTFVKVKGHSGEAYNEIVDCMAKAEVVKARDAACVKS